MASILQGSAFISGAGGGIGRGTALSLARHGVSKFALGDISLPQLEVTQKEILDQFPNVEVLLLELDVTSEKSVDQALAKTADAFDRIDYAINNAGVAGPFMPTDTVSAHDWERSYDINIHGVWRCQRAQLRIMLKQELRETTNRLHQSRGIIINVASILGLIGASGDTPAAAYSSAKHAIMGLTKTDARYYAKYDIRINAICPAYIDTPLLGNLEDEIRDKLVSTIPASRLGKPEEVGNAIVFLCSYLSSYVVGHGLVLDGGQLTG